ncbi:1499_t:CDS:2 [Ambispora gerdemannii]|uniref:1499_t:CDS:1 n=1 Tax=Ambispora gerdemannii TaxID=144530 RepID=A0A9N8YNF6_9GLOM|nr:1499_t:CDS:2 [Ambispora gerdemannii]
MSRNSWWGLMFNEDNNSNNTTNPTTEEKNPEELRDSNHDDTNMSSKDQKPPSTTTNYNKDSINVIKEIILEEDEELFSGGEGKSRQREGIPIPTTNNIASSDISEIPSVASTLVEQYSQPQSQPNSLQPQLGSPAIPIPRQQNQNMRRHDDTKRASLGSFRGWWYPNSAATHNSVPSTSTSANNNNTGITIATTNTNATASAFVPSENSSKPAPNSNMNNSRPPSLQRSESPGLPLTPLMETFEETRLSSSSSSRNSWWIFGGGNHSNIINNGKISSSIASSFLTIQLIIMKY